MHAILPCVCYGYFEEKCFMAAFKLFRYFYNKIGETANVIVTGHPTSTGYMLFMAYQYIRY